MTETLLPCPFCLGEAEVYFDDYEETVYEMVTCAKGNGCAGREVYVTKDEWNTRTTPQPIDDWFPIETAPKDGTRILAYDADALEQRDNRQITIAYWVSYTNRLGQVYREMWQTDAYAETGQVSPKPTHWMPLPKPPEGR